MTDSAEGVGSLADEAAKLFAALSGPASKHGGDEATGGGDCTYCPVCRAIHVVRETSPEVRAHLAVAASSLIQAAAGLLATATPQDQRPAPRPGVEHIDLDGDVPPAENPDGPDNPAGPDDPQPGQQP